MNGSHKRKARPKAVIYIAVAIIAVAVLIFWFLIGERIFELVMAPAPAVQSVPQLPPKP